MTDGDSPFLSIDFPTSIHLFKFNSSFPTSLILSKINFNYPTSAITFQFQLKLPNFGGNFPISARTFQVQLELSNFDANFRTSARTFHLQSFQFHFGLCNFSFFQLPFPTTCTQEKFAREKIFAYFRGYEVSTVYEACTSTFFRRHFE